MAQLAATCWARAGLLFGARSVAAPAAAAARGASLLTGEPGRRTMADLASLNPRDAVICSAVRTPVGAFQGSLSALTATQLGGVAIRGEGCLVCLPVLLTSWSHAELPAVYIAT